MSGTGERRLVHILERDGFRNTAAALICGILYLLYLVIYLPFLPTATGTLGHDYGLHFPNLLTGFYWFVQNGVWSIPWFSPSQCGGVPYFPDPNVAYLSVPQFLVFLVSPMQAVQITFALFALIGLLGSYILMRFNFRSSRSAAVLAAGFFLFNGFFAYRVLIGHLTFHAFALVPLMIAALLPVHDRSSPAGLIVRTCVAALCLAYMLQSGMVHGIPPAVLAAIIIFLIHALCFGWQWRPWLLLAGSGVLSLMLCAGKLTAELAMLSNFPRDDYPLAGIPGLAKALEVVAHALFVSPPSDPGGVMTNSQWLFDRHEWEYGVSIGPLVLLAMAAIISRFRIKANGDATVLTFVLWSRPFSVLTGGRIPTLAAIMALSAIPLVLNWYQPDWNGFLKSLPYFGNSTSLLRFFSAYIPIVVVAACLVFDRLLPRETTMRAVRLSLAAVVLCIVVAQNAAADRSYYANQTYRIGPVETEYARAHATRRVPIIETIGDRSDPAWAPNDSMIQGISQRYCYQPMFGYRLEKFPAAPLQVGPVIAPIGQLINIKNPACYVYAAENGCKPGDHFQVDQVENAVAFLTYRPFAFEQPLWQKLASWLSPLSMIAVAATLLVCSILCLIRRKRIPTDEFTHV